MTVSKTDIIIKKGKVHAATSDEPLQHYQNINSKWAGGGKNAKHGIKTIRKMCVKIILYTKLYITYNRYSIIHIRNI